MALVTCAGADVISGRIHMPIRGAWWADLKLDLATVPSGQTTIAAANGISLTGFITRAGVFVDVVHAKLVAGAGGLAKVVPAVAYRNAQLRDPLAAIISASGETQSTTIASDVLGTVLPAWTLVAGHAGQELDQLAFLAGGTWRVLTDGTIWIGVDSFPSQALTPGSDIVYQMPQGGLVEIGTETPLITPGINLSDIGANILGVDHWIEHDKIRTMLWTSLAT